MRPPELFVACEADRELLFSLHRAAFRSFVEERFGSWDDADQRALFGRRQPGGVAEVVVSGGEAVGAVHWRVDGDGALFVDLLEIRQEDHGHGLGSAVLAQLQQRAGPRQPVRLQVRKDNERARAVYERAGFRTAGETQTHWCLGWQGTGPPEHPPDGVVSVYTDEVVRSLAAAIGRSPVHAGMPRRVAGLDGCGGAGKSTLARRLSAELGGAPIVPTDDFASWDEPVEWWPRLVTEVLEPIRRRNAAGYHRYDWSSRALAERVEVPEHDLLLVEGVGSTRRAFDPYLSARVFVDCPRTIRLQRGLARDGAAMLAQWEEWMAAEDAYVATESPRESADWVVLGFSPFRREQWSARGG